MFRETRPRRCAERESTCALCGRQVSRLSKHHVVPKSEGGLLTVWLCSACHRTVHSFFTNRTLAKEKYSIDALRQDPDIQRYLAWVCKQPDRAIPVRSSTRRR
jgi:5-methylcytosine-specific restriction protein A